MLLDTNQNISSSIADKYIVALCGRWGQIKANKVIKDERMSHLVHRLISIWSVIVNYLNDNIIIASLCLHSRSIESNWKAVINI